MSVRNALLSVILGIVKSYLHKGSEKDVSVWQFTVHGQFQSDHFSILSIKKAGQNEQPFSEKLSAKLEAGPFTTRAVRTRPVSVHIGQVLISSRILINGISGNKIRDDLRMIPNLVRHDEWFDLSGSVFLEFVVREVERENCENKFVRISHFSFEFWVVVVLVVRRESRVLFSREIRAKSDLFFNRPKRCF